jgi:hypothetical protein
MGGVKPTHSPEDRKQIMRKTLIGGIVAAGILTMPLAHADGNIDEFNQYLLQHGIASDSTSTNGLTYLANGRNACAAKRAGVSNLEQYLLQQGMDRAGASDVALAAPRYLCPDA